MLRWPITDPDRSPYRRFLGQLWLGTRRDEPCDRFMMVLPNVSYLRLRLETAPTLLGLTSRNGKNRTLGNENGSGRPKISAFYPPVLTPDVIDSEVDVFPAKGR
jgi:hypothetical protein